MFLLLTTLAVATTITSCQGNALRSSTRFELERYKHRNDVLLELLTKEGCSALSQQNRSRRSVSSPELELEIEKVVFEELIEKLAECRVTTTAPATTMPTKTPTTTTVLPQPTECRSAINLTEYWRKDYIGSSIKPRNSNNNNGFNCDHTDLIASGRPWFRFSGAAGSRLIDHCVISKTSGHESCGTQIAFWSNTTMPHQIGVVTSIQLYGSWSNGCTARETTGSVVKCSDQTNDFVYKYLGNIGCGTGFCGMD